jgi:hypothetical protein
MTTNTNLVSKANLYLPKNGLFLFLARKGDRVAERCVLKPANGAPQSVVAPVAYNAADFGNLDTAHVVLAIASDRIQSAIAQGHNGFIHVYSDIRVVLKYREVIANRNLSIDELDNVIVKDFMNERQANIVKNFARTLRAAAVAGIYVSFIDWRSIWFLEFSNPDNKPLKAGNKITFTKGMSGNMKTYGLQVTGTFEVIESTREGEKGRALLDIRKFGNPNNRNSVLNFARNTYNVLQTKLVEGRTWADLLEEESTGQSVIVEDYDMSAFDDVVA